MIGKDAAVTLHPHALQRMGTRLVSRRQIEQTIAMPTRTSPSSNPPGRIVAERVTAAGNTLRVVYVERAVPDGIEAFVLTVVRIGGRTT
jgi:hypothetical protein